MVLCGSASLAGRKHTDGLNEDRLVLDPGSGILGIFDGHGGSSCAQFLKANVVDLLDVALKKRKIFPYECSTNENNQMYNANQMKDALYETFEGLENRFKKVAFDTEDTSGACGLIGLVHDDYCVIAHAGDCRAIYKRLLSKHIGPFRKHSRPVQITEDHRVNFGKEKDRIIMAGGAIDNGRIASLAPSRTIGDWDVKTSVAPDIILSSPEMNHFPVVGPTIMIIATDGVWDGMSNKEAMEIVESFLKNDPGNVNGAAEALVKEGYVRAKDDVSAIVVLWD